jgi:hypothetical protein
MDYSTDVVRALFEMMGTYGIAILELPGGLKIVKAPDTAPTVQTRPEPPARPENIADDPWLYPDGEVPTFSRP